MLRSAGKGDFSTSVIFYRAAAKFAFVRGRVFERLILKRKT